VRAYGARRPHGCGPVATIRGQSGARVDDVMGVAGRRLPTTRGPRRGRQTAMRERDQYTGVSGAFGERDHPGGGRLTSRPQIPTDLDEYGASVARAEDVRSTIRGPRLRRRTEVKRRALRYAEQGELAVEANLLPAGHRLRGIRVLREAPPYRFDVLVVPG